MEKDIQDGAACLGRCHIHSKNVNPHPPIFREAELIFVAHDRFPRALLTWRAGLNLINN